MARPKPAQILVVDDDRSTQRVLADALKKQGFDVTVERDGEWAVQTFEKKSFDAVILDLLLPAVSGYDVAQQLRAMPKGQRVPIIVMSGVYKSSIHQKEAITKHGAFAFLEKPVELPLLYETLKNALGSRYPSLQKPKVHEPVPPPVEEDEVTGEYMADDNQREEVQVVEQQAKKEAPTKPLVKGDFSLRPFAEVLAQLHRDKVTGALLLRREKVKKIVYFRDGTPELVKSNLLVECLGRILVREKMISDAECEESLRRMQSSKRMQGTVLIDMGCLSPHNLKHALSMQLQEKLFDAFRWDSGEYQLNPDGTPPPEPLSLGMSSAQLILEGVKRTYDEERLGKAMHGLEQCYVHPSEDTLAALQDAGLGDEERELMQLVDGHKTVATLRALELLPQLETDQLLFAMKCAQMIDIRSDPAEGKPRMSIVNMAALTPKALPPMPPPLPTAPTMPPPLPPKPLTAVSAAPPLGALVADPTESVPPAGSQPLSMPPPPPPDLTPPQSAQPAKKPEPAKPMMLLPELPEISSGPRLSDAEGLVREHLAAKAAAMRRLDYFEILGVKANATREDVKRAYFGLAKEYHPDKHFDSKSAEVKQLAQQIYDLISAAHDTLADSTERDRYVKELAQGLKRDMGEDVSKILAAEGKFQRGEEMMRQRNYPLAVKAFGDAIELYPEEGEFHAWLGWAMFQVDVGDANGAMDAIERAISLNPKLDKAYLFLGYIQKSTGRPDKAEKQFEKAIQCNPDCTEALRELRLLGNRGKR